MAALTPVVVARSGADLTSGLTAAGGSGDTFPAGYQNFLRIKNGNAAVCTPTFTPPSGGGPAGTTVAPFVSTNVPATTGDRLMGPFPANPFADQNGNVNVTYSVTSTVTVIVYQMSAS